MSTRWTQSVEQIVAAIAAVDPKPYSLFVAIDGRSGAGKSTLAAEVGAALDECLVIDCDDFYGGGTSAEWDARSARANSARAMDWRQQRAVLGSLRDTGSASWRAYDWEAFDGSRVQEPTVVHASRVVILEGAYSCRPELSDLLDVRVLVEATDAMRRARLQRREGADYNDPWFGRWEAAEEWYFSQVMPPTAFDLAVRT